MLLQKPTEPELLQQNATPYDVLRVHATNALAWKQARDNLNALILWAQE
jgi:hypothetical protein